MYLCIGGRDILLSRTWNDRDIASGVVAVKLNLKVTDDRSTLPHQSTRTVRSLTYTTPLNTS